MKIVYFTDSHLALNGPISRIDDYGESILEKIEEVLQFAQEKSADGVICGGDLFNSPTPSLFVVKKLITLLNNYNQKLYLCIGNHDIFGHQKLTIDRTIIGVLEESKVIIITDSLMIEDVSIAFKHYEHGIENLLTSPYVTADIIVNHAMITDCSFFGDFVKYADVNQDCKLMFCSHYHPGFGVQRANNTFFVAPGALARTSMDAHNLVRQPSFVYLDMTKSKLNELKIIPLKCAKDAKDIFNTANKISEDEKPSLDKSKYLDMMSALELGKVNLSDIIKEIGRQEKVDQLIVEEALLRIQ